MKKELLFAAHWIVFFLLVVLLCYRVTNIFLLAVLLIGVVIPCLGVAYFHILDRLD